MLVLIAVLLFIFPQVKEAGSPDSGANESRTKSAAYSAAAEALQNKPRVNVLFAGEIDKGLLESYQAEILTEYESISAVTVSLDSDAAARLADEEGILSVTEDQLVEKQAQQTGWAHQSIILDKKQPSGLSGKGIKIAIIDSGIDKSHPDLKVAGGICVLPSEAYGCKNDYNDDNGHGTHVAGIIAAQNNEIGTVGVAHGASIYAVKALDSIGEGTTSSILAGVDWAIKNKMDIINLSLTTDVNDLAMKAILDKAYKAGILIVGAAGNQGHASSTGSEENVQYPAKYASVIAVSATNSSKGLNRKSSVGTEIELAAPGGSIYSTYPAAIDKSDGLADGYSTMSGTSMASPHVAGMAALYMEKYPNLSHEEIRSLLQENASDLGAPGKDRLFGHGLIQADTFAGVATSASAAYTQPGVAAIKVENLPDDAIGYNLYRFGRKIVTAGTEETVLDYGSKGLVEYKLVPVNQKGEMLRQAVKLKVNFAGPALSDMDNKQWFNRNILYLYKEGVMTGYKNGTMKPYEKITRSQAITMLAKAIGLSPVTGPSPFKDVPANSFATGYVTAAKKAGIINGFKDRTFRGDQYVTRAEMSIMISRGFELQFLEGDSLYFNDMNSSIAGYQEIRNLASNRITEGYADGTFRPAEQMTRATYAVFISKAMNESLK